VNKEAFCWCKKHLLQYGRGCKQRACSLLSVYS